MSQSTLFEAHDRKSQRSGAIISADGLYRYALWRRALISGDTRVLALCMLNPSKADDMRDDPTIRKAAGFAKRLGFGELVVVNLYAWRSTLPRDLFAAEQRGIDIVGPDNDRWIIAICRAADLILAAWGNGGQTARASEVVRLLRGHCAETTIVRLGRLTSAGCPRHPLYVPYSTPVQAISDRAGLTRE